VSTAEKIQAAAVVVAVLAFVGREIHASRIERKRTQPIVIAHERDSWTIASGGQWAAEVYLTNDGGGSAFNVRFGVEFRGVRFPYRWSSREPRGGSRTRVVRKDEAGAAEREISRISIEPTELWGGSGLKQLHLERVYWCRYENATGATWETRNPADRSAHLQIRRVYLPRFREWREDFARRRAAKAGQKKESPRANDAS
jgi:hypothetical protein